MDPADNPDRSGEKKGWVLGWLGGFIWVVILSFVFLLQRKLLGAFAGLVLTGAAVATVLATAPWKHVDTRRRWSDGNVAEGRSS